MPALPLSFFTFASSCFFSNFFFFLFLMKSSPFLTKFLAPSLILPATATFATTAVPSAAAPAIATPLIKLPNRPPPPPFLGLADASFFINLLATSVALPRNSTVESNLPFIPSRLDPN